MPRFVALFRGINVGKAKRMAMADLRAVLAELGYSNARTLLNSGNAIFESSGGSNFSHAQLIRKAVADRLGVDALVLVKSASEVTAVMSGNTLGTKDRDPSRLLVALTADSAALATLDTLAKAEWGAEQVHIGTHAAYVWCANGILESKVAVTLLKCLADKGTTRNWATMEKIHALLQGEE